MIQTGKIFLQADPKTDLIAIKDNEITLIQCKDYDTDKHSYQVEKQELIDIEKEMDKFIKQHTWGNQKIQDIKIRIFISNSKILTAKAKEHCRENPRMKYAVLNQENYESYIQNQLKIL